MKLAHATALEAALRLTGKEMRRHFEAADLQHMTIEVEVDGAVMHGDLKVQFCVRCERYGESVKAGTLEAAVTELMRRKGWSERNAPLCLPRVDNDDIRVALPANGNGHATAE